MSSTAAQQPGELIGMRYELRAAFIDGTRRFLEAWYHRAPEQQCHETVEFCRTTLATYNRQHVHKGSHRTANAAFVTAFRILVADTSWAEALAAMNSAWRIHCREVRSRDSQIPLFAGDVYVPSRDDSRLLAQLVAVVQVLLDGQWHTIEEIAQRIQQPVASIGAQTRHLRKVQWGSWLVDKQHARNSNLWEFRMRNPDGTVGPPWRPDPQPFDGTL